MVIRISDPMAYNNNILLGKITKLSGYEGAVSVRVEKIFIENIPILESVFLEIEGRPVPFFISGSEYSGADMLKLWFDGYDSKEKISEFIGCSVFLTEGKKGDDQIVINPTLAGYSIYINKEELLGTISEIISNNGQLLFNVQSKNTKDILIPYHEDFIVNIDNEKKCIVMNLPDGLTEIN